MFIPPFFCYGVLIIPIKSFFEDLKVSKKYEQ
ncbi:hypothetical protein CKC_01440 [Candidatus Liberibacter solanacearum CLso-ZC1]|uniref:Uncharacterized protein n=1 Tax=Liberibacter solanacearum (strain CLso-ZC1) TaxID=658172 RepID=E4UCE9_LIBSC|nr:hypothetical protein CKC_01440 [Candidatus Liberibacter solanacearum CLso-ZC1]